MNKLLRIIRNLFLSKEEILRRNEISKYYDDNISKEHMSKNEFTNLMKGKSLPNSGKVVRFRSYNK